MLQIAIQLVNHIRSGGIYVRGGVSYTPRVTNILGQLKSNKGAYCLGVGCIIHLGILHLPHNIAP